MFKIDNNLFDSDWLIASQHLFHGVEKENVRVDKTGHIARTPHPKAFGPALTNPWITLDFAETLIEFVTPPCSDFDLSFDQLRQVNQYVSQKIGREMLWPNSMPCAIKDPNHIDLANFGRSNKAWMKHIYRRGLCYRYGRIMQMIAGIHYNMSFPHSFWESWQAKRADKQPLPQFIDQQYFKIIRNFFRYSWVLPYLFGASPVCANSSVIQAVDYIKPFDNASMVGPYATCLRLSDLGYQNKGQDLLNINYDNIERYAHSIRSATERTYPEFEAIGIKDEQGLYKQLNVALLQIENEYYIPIRPKQPIQSGERPTRALLNRGVDYLEIRLLDLDPFQPYGMHPTTGRFMDLFLMYCLLRPDAALKRDEFKRQRQNLKRVATHGRDPYLKINSDSGQRYFKDMAEAMLVAMQPLAVALDRYQQDNVYQNAWQHQYQKLHNPELIPSQQIVDQMEFKRQGFTEFNLNLAQQHKKFLNQTTPNLTPFFNNIKQNAWRQFQRIESQPQQSFEECLRQYFSQ